MPIESTEHLLVEQQGSVVILTFNNPKLRNAFTDDMHEGMQEFWEQLDRDESVRAVVLTGNGKSFSTGGNVAGFVSAHEDMVRRRRAVQSARRILDAQAGFSKPVVAAVNGPAVGLGCSVAISCDIVLIAEDAYFADTHVNVGLVAGDGGVELWPLMMSLLKAKEYLLTGDRIPATAAVSLGLANRVVPNDQLLAEALALAQRLAEQPAEAIQGTKRALNMHTQSVIQHIAPFALEAEYVSWGSDDVRRSIESFSKPVAATK
ncbi:enoyl-CoA hydratase/isomerase family protein [Rhodococcus wratislaviensis]|uniref:enoyl-CoA hydratase/isomerase family protein n=1 Tax=Rhodococcus wratislaviensis TaxID=44752 RepID=UPI003660A34A